MIFRATKHNITHEWTKEELIELIERYGYYASSKFDYEEPLLTDFICQRLVDALIWNLEIDTDKTSYNDSIEDLLADILIGQQ